MDDSNAPPSPATVAKVVVIFALLLGFGVENVECLRVSESEVEASSGYGSFSVPILVFYQMDSIELDWVWIAFAWMRALCNNVVPHWSL